MSEVLARGAEAVLTREKWDSLDCVLKKRVKKGYRIEELDEKLRVERTKEEAKLLSEARRVSVPTPQVYEKEESELKIEFVEGERLKDLIYEFSSGKREEVARRIGRLIAKLHQRGIVHGDLTTSNLLMKDNEIYFIDFGLGYFSDSVEDKAVDLYLLLEVLRSTHPRFKDELWSNLVEAYAEEYGKGGKVLDRVEEIGMRGRYVSKR